MGKRSESENIVYEMQLIHEYDVLETQSLVSLKHEYDVFVPFVWPGLLTQTPRGSPTNASRVCTTHRMASPVGHATQAYTPRIEVHPDLVGHPKDSYGRQPLSTSHGWVRIHDSPYHQVIGEGLRR